MDIVLVARVSHKGGVYMKLTVDRIEEFIVICENDNREMLEIRVDQFVKIPKEGDIVYLNDDGKYDVLKEETDKREEEIKKRFSRLFNK